MGEEKFDTLGRIIKHVEPVTGTIYEYEYSEDGSRIVIITNESNKSNFKTIKKQNLVNGEYINEEVNEFGETYNILMKYNKENKENYYERTNIKTGKIFKKKSIWRDGKVYLWTTEYDGETKKIGFRMTQDIITGITNNKI